MRYSQLFNTIMKSFRRFWSTKSSTNYVVLTPVQSSSSQRVIVVACRDCFPTSQQHGYPLEVLAVNPPIFLLCPHVRIGVETLGKASLLPEAGSMYQLMKVK